jgi:hypothetical protein
MGLSADIKTIRYATPGNSTQPTNLPMNAGSATAVTVYRGSIALTDQNGWVKNAATPVVSDTCWGLIDEGGPGYVPTGPGVTNTGASGATTVDIATGTFWLGNSTGGDLITEAMVGKNVYVFNESAVAATSNGNTRPVAGVLIKASDPLNVLSGLVAVHMGSNQSSGGPS